MKIITEFEVERKWQIRQLLREFDVFVTVSSNGAPWARPGAMPRGPKWGGANFAPPQKRAQGQLPIFDFLT